MTSDVPCKQALTDCKSNKGGFCIALNNTDFKRPCPFYEKKGAKQDEQNHHDGPVNG